MDGAHHLAAARGDAAVQQQPVEADAFVAQRIAFVDADHDRRQPAHIVGRGERRATPAGCVR